MPLPSIADTKFHKNIMERLAQVDNIPAVNNGGCGIVAHALVEYINKEYPGRKAEIVYLSNRRSEFENLSNNEPSSCSHAVVKTNNKYYDSEGSYDLSSMNGYDHRVPLTQDLGLRSIHGDGWNDWFDREEEAPKIAKIFGIDTDYVRAVV